MKRATSWVLGVALLALAVYATVSIATLTNLPELIEEKNAPGTTIGGSPFDAWPILLPLGGLVAITAWILTFLRAKGQTKDQTER